jgi:hypothetical protein
MLEDPVSNADQVCQHQRVDNSLCFTFSKKDIQVEIGVWEGEFLNRNLPNSLDEKLLMLRQASVQFSDGQLIFFLSSK